MTKIKICGVTNEKDAKFISMLDVDYIGINLATGTKRAVSENALLKITSVIPPYIIPVAVMINPELKDIKRILKKTAITHYQLHGCESVDFVMRAKELGVKIIKAFRPKNASEALIAAEFLEAADYFLIDAYSQHLPGGTGKEVSFSRAKKMKELGKPLFLAGGLNPDNVADAIREVSPFAVDAASGVEKTPRSKDIEKVRCFIRAVRGKSEE